MPFHDRVDELTSLRNAWDADRAQLFVVWGRRRVGKTGLLDRFRRGRPGVLFEAPEGSATDQLADFSRELGAAWGNRLVLEQPLTSWQAAFTAIEQWSRQAGRVIVVLDEFQRIARNVPEIGGILNAWWRRAGRDTRVFLVLSGSEVSFFRRDVLSAAATIYGRRTGQMQITPFGYREAGEFLPRWPAADRLRAYAVCGGMPYYLEQLDHRRSLRDNIHDAVLRREAVLREEARLLLHQELPEPDAYFSVLRAIANGATRHGQIVQRTGLEQRAVLRALEVLQSLFLVEKQVPVTVANPDRTRSTAYAICDDYLNFWFSFVLPYQSRLDSASGIAAHLDGLVMPRLDEFVSKPAFERACRQYVQRVEPDLATVGSWWGAVSDPDQPRRTLSREVDVVGVGRDRTVAVLGSCKWTAGRMGVGEDRALTQLEPYVGRAADGVRHYLFCREGFTTELRRMAAANPERLRLVSPSTMFEG